MNEGGHHPCERRLGEARDILSGIGVLGEDGPMAQGINKAYALMVQGLYDFLRSKRGIKSAADASPIDTSSA